LGQYKKLIEVTFIYTSVIDGPQSKHSQLQLREKYFFAPCISLSYTVVRVKTFLLNLKTVMEILKRK